VRAAPGRQDRVNPGDVREMLHHAIPCEGTDCASVEDEVVVEAIIREGQLIEVFNAGCGVGWQPSGVRADGDSRDGVGGVSVAEGVEEIGKGAFAFADADIIDAIGGVAEAEGGVQAAPDDGDIESGFDGPSQAEAACCVAEHEADADDVGLVMEHGFGDRVDFRFIE